MAKKKKKSQSGGLGGKPANTEPRVQLFSKFNGCNFQLSTRDMDDLFADDQEAQTDLMPLYMAIQNNANIAPMGGIETRPNMTRIIEAPEGKELSGVATFVGNKIFAACTDMTVYVGDIPSEGTRKLSQQITINDVNQSYSPAVTTTYSGTVV